MDIRAKKALSEFFTSLVLTAIFGYLMFTLEMKTTWQTVSAALALLFGILLIKSTFKAIPYLIGFVIGGSFTLVTKGVGKVAQTAGNAMLKKSINNANHENTIALVSAIDNVNVYFDELYRHFLVIAGTGAGKSASIVKPMIKESITKNFSGLILDYKYPELANYVYSHYQNHKSGVTPIFVNFDDLSRSVRFNPLANSVKNSSFARELATSIVENLSNGDSNNKNEFFVKSAESLLAGIIYFLAKKHPQHLSIPHAVALSLQPIEKVVELISTDFEVSAMVASIKTAIDNQAGKQLAGVVSTLQDGLSRLATPNIFWVLSAEEVHIDINNPDAPQMLVLGNNALLSTTYAPILSLILVSSLQKMNVPGKHKSMVILDEAQTTKIPKLEQILAVCRSNKISISFITQDLSQIEDVYGHVKKDVLLGNFSNMLFGKTNHLKTAEYVSNLVGKGDIVMENKNVGYSVGEKGHITETETKTYSSQERILLKPQQIMGFGEGVFINFRPNYQPFTTQYKPAQEVVDSLPAFRQISNQEIEDNYSQIFTDIESLMVNIGKKII